MTYVVMKFDDDVIPELIKHHLHMATELYVASDRSNENICAIFDDMEDDGLKTVFTNFVTELKMFDVREDEGIAMFAMDENTDMDKLHNFIHDAVED